MKKKEPAAISGHKQPNNNNDNTLALIRQALEQRGGVTEEKDGFVGLCPYHDDRDHPNLKVFNNGGFYCRACQTRGSHDDLAERLGIETKRGSRSSRAYLYKFEDYLSRRLLAEPKEIPKLAQILGIYASSPDKLDLKFCTADGRFIGNIEHKPNAPKKEKYKNPPGRMKGNLFGLDRALNLHAIVAEGHSIASNPEEIKAIKGSLILTEGVFDALVLLRFGLPAAAILGSGNSSPEMVYNVLVDHGISHVILAFDRDDPGHRFTLNFLEYFVTRQEILTQVILLDDLKFNGKDLNDALQDLGSNALSLLTPLDPIEAFMILNDTKNAIIQGEPARHKAVLEVARFYHKMHPIQREKINEITIIERLGLSENEWKALFVELAELEDKERIKGDLMLLTEKFKRELMENPHQAFEHFEIEAGRRLRFLDQRKPLTVKDEIEEILQEIKHEKDGIPLFEQLQDIKIMPDDLVILAGPSGVGKTTIALNITAHFIKQKKRVLYVSYEVNRGRILSKIYAIDSGKEYKSVYYKLKHGEIRPDPELIKYLAIISDPAVSIEEISRLVKRYQEINPLDLVVIDYDQLCSTETKSESEERRVAYISQTSKHIALKNHVPVLLLSQLTGENLRYSAQKEFDASVIIYLKPEPQTEGMEDRTIYLTLKKNRYGPTFEKKELSVNFATGTIWLK